MGDLGVGERAAQQCYVEHIMQLDVVRPVSPARYEVRIFLTRYASSDVALRCFGHSITFPFLGRRGRLAHLLCGLLNGLDDVLVACAATIVSFQGLTDLLLARLWILIDQADGGDHHARRAVAALQGVVLMKRRLHGMPLSILGESLYRRDLVSIGLHREYSARLDRLPIHKYRARSAVRGVAPD